MPAALKALSAARNPGVSPTGSSMPTPGKSILAPQPGPRDDPVANGIIPVTASTKGPVKPRPTHPLGLGKLLFSHRRGVSTVPHDRTTMRASSTDVSPVAPTLQVTPHAAPDMSVLTLTANASASKVTDFPIRDQQSAVSAIGI